MKPEPGTKIISIDKIKCTKVDWKTQVEAQVELNYFARFGPFHQWWFYIIGGPTGFKSFNMDNSNNIKGGWWACAGTYYDPEVGFGGRYWDGLFVPEEELTKAVKYLKEKIKEYEN